jgi:hypothetical protein
MTVRCLLWDFGDTLCHETFIWSSGPEWQAVYQSFDGGWAEGWNDGTMDTSEFARLASAYIPLPPDRIVAHMRERCEHIDFFEFTYAFYLDRHLPQAIVTVNPDLWTETIVPLHGFDRSADVIVSSWQEGTIDKAILCHLALDRLGIGCAPSEALLIDNKQSNLDAWATRGGVGYLFTTDAAFQRDVAGGIDGLLGA